LSADIRNLEDISLMEKVNIMFKLIILSVVVNPWVYGSLYPVLSFFKAGLPNPDFKTAKYSAYQAGVVLSLSKTIDELSRKRYEHGIRFIEGLKDIDGIKLPQIPDNTQPAFNHFPVVFEDLDRMARMEKKIWQQGIGTSRMYPAPLHYIFDLGYNKDDFPNACYLSKHLLTLPVHPLLKDEDIDKIITTIRRS
jgi:dTDP-4-amino-4,6-dideoxygalactose transaminase